MKFNPVELVEIYEPTFDKGESRFRLREVIVNTDRVIYLRENSVYNDLVDKEQVGLDEGHKFSTLHLTDGSIMTIVGSPAVVAEKLNGRRVL